MRYFNEIDYKQYNKKFILEDYDIKKAIYVPRDKSVFLSHSSKDIDKLEYVIRFLESFGVKVYIDKTDEKLPRITSTETAKILKENIKRCKKFIVLVSENSKDSRWIPWEVGIADIAKTTDNIALLPVSTVRPSWVNQEYMGLYKRIINEDYLHNGSDSWYVYDNNTDTFSDLKWWINN